MVPPVTEVLEIVINGEKRLVPSGLSVVNLLKVLEIAPDRVAIELNRHIIRQPAWADTLVEAGAQIEIVQFVGGG